MNYVACSVCGEMHGVSGKSPRQLTKPCSAVSPSGVTCGAIGLHWGHVPVRLGVTSNPIQPFESNGQRHVHTWQNAGATATPPITVSAPNPTPVSSSIDASALAGITAQIDELKAWQTAAESGINGITDIVREKMTEMRARIDTEFDAIKTTINASRTISVYTPVGTTVNVGRQHWMYENVLAAVSSIGRRGVVYLVGKSGGGKTSIWQAVADALGVPLYTQPCTVSEARLFGFADAYGKLVETAAYKAWSGGGLLNLAEYDLMTASMGVLMNNFLDGAYFDFPVVGRVKRHPQCYIVADGNTHGRGATAEYVGRNQLDAATLTRLVYMPFPPDWEFIGHLSGFSISNGHPRFPNPTAPVDPVATYPDWGEYIHRVETAVAVSKVRAVPTSRAVFNGASLLAAGICRELVEAACIWEHMSETDADTVKANL